MKCTKTVGFCFARILTSSIIMSANGAVLTENPYKPIATRNVFALNAVSLPQSVPQPPMQIVKISLTGIITILGPPDVLFKASDPAEPGKPEKSYLLGEGQIQDGIEVMSINAKESLVIFKNHDVIQKISFESDTINAREPKHPPVPGTL